MIINSTFNDYSAVAAPSLQSAAPNVIADGARDVNSCDCSFAKDFYRNFGRSCISCAFGKNKINFNNY